MDVFGTAGGATMASAVIAVNVLSVLIMAVIVAEFLHIQFKRTNLLRSLGSGRADIEFRQGRILMWLYIVSTVAITAVTIVAYFSPLSF